MRIQPWINKVTKYNLLLETRRNNLRLLVRQRSNKEVAVDLNWPESRLSQLIGPTPFRNVTEKTAAHIEERLGLETGWLNEPRADIWFEYNVDMTQYQACERGA